MRFDKGFKIIVIAMSVVWMQNKILGEATIIIEASVVLVKSFKKDFHNPLFIANAYWNFDFAYFNVHTGMSSYFKIIYDI